MTEPSSLAEYTGVRGFEECDVVLQAALGAVCLVQPVSELLHARVVATIDVLLRLAELCGKIVGSAQL